MLVWPYSFVTYAPFDLSYNPYHLAYFFKQNGVFLTIIQSFSQVSASRTGLYFIEEAGGVDVGSNSFMYLPNSPGFSLEATIIPCFPNVPKLPCSSVEVEACGGKLLGSG